MKKLIIVLCALMLAAVPVATLNANENGSDSKTSYWYTSINMSTCSDNEDTASWQGGTMWYGCSTYATDETYTDYVRGGTNTYMALVQTGNSLNVYGSLESDGVVSSAQAVFDSGTQWFGMDD